MLQPVLYPLVCTSFPYPGIGPLTSSLYVSLFLFLLNSLVCYVFYILHVSDIIPYLSDSSAVLINLKQLKNMSLFQRSCLLYQMNLKKNLRVLK